MHPVCYRFIPFLHRQKNAVDLVVLEVKVCVRGDQLRLRETRSHVCQKERMDRKIDFFIDIMDLFIPLLIGTLCLDFERRAYC